MKLTDRDRARRITTLWTLKEGYTKAIGEGIGFGLERIKVDLDEGGQARKVWVDGRDLRDEGWEWLCGPLGDGGYGWAAYWQGDVLEDGPGVELVMNEVEWEEFLKHFEETSSQPVL